jgi:hypothetical protein
MDPADVATFGGQPKGLRTDLKICCGSGQVEPLNIAVLWWMVNRDFVMRPECVHALPRPTVAMAGPELVAV